MWICIYTMPKANRRIGYAGFSAGAELCDRCELFATWDLYDAWVRVMEVYVAKFVK